MHAMHVAIQKANMGLCLWLEAEMEETEMLMGCPQIYKKSGRAFALSGMSSHATQRATTRCGSVLGSVTEDEDEDEDEDVAMGCPMGMSDDDEDSDEYMGYGMVAAAPSRPPAVSFGGYVTPNMAFMVKKSQQLNNKEDTCTPKED